MAPLKKSFSLGLVLTVLLTAGCDSVCNRTVEDFAKVQNMTGRTLQLTFCKTVDNGKTTSDIPADTVINEIGLASHSDKEIVGGPGGCNGVKDSREATGISLATESFGQVKLCKGQGSGDTYVIVETSLSCPTNFDEQLSAGPCL